MQGHVFAAGGGTKASIGAAMGIWGDPTGFVTAQPLTFEDFDGAWVRYTNLGISGFLGYSKSYISFVGLGSGAQSINVSGWSAGTVGAGGAVIAGKLGLEGSYPASRVNIKDTDVMNIPYDRMERGADKYSVLFATERDTLNATESALLDSFVASVVATRR
jgi:hypothetical protein